MTEVAEYRGMNKFDRILTIVLYLTLYGYLGYQAAWFHGVVARVPPAVAKMVGI